MSPILSDADKDKWYGYNYNYATIENSSKRKEADYAKSNVSAPTINFNVDKIEKTADINEIMREATKQYIQYFQTRNALV